MFKQLLNFIMVCSLFVASLGYANEAAEFVGSKGVVEEIGKLMDYIVVDGTRCRMNAATKVMDNTGKVRARGALKLDQEIRVFFDVAKLTKAPPMLTKIVILGGPKGD